MPKPTDSTSRQRPWISLGLSAALHAALLVLTVQLAREPAPTAPEERRGAAADRARQVEMVYLPPPPQAPPPPPPEPQPAPQPPPSTPPPPPAPAPTPPPERSAPPPEKEQRTPEPDANAPPEAARTPGEEPAKDDPAGGERTGAPNANDGSPAPAPADNAAPTMESEARRIFGRPRLGPQPGAGPRASRPMEAYLPDHPEKCIPKPSAPRDATAEPQYGLVVGKIFRQDNGRPLSGAHLQMLGTPYVTFTDDGGEYRFRFDLALVDNCRTQYVRVTAPGYESRLLVLMVGENVRSDDVALKRR